MSSCLENVYSCAYAQLDVSRVTMHMVSTTVLRRIRIISSSPRMAELKGLSLAYEFTILVLKLRSVAAELVFLIREQGMNHE